MRAVEDHHVDRPEVEAGQPAQLTGTNRSIGLTDRRLPTSARHRPRPAPRFYPRESADPRCPAASPEDTLPPHITRTPSMGALCRPGGHSEGPNTRSHPELGRENPLRQWYCTSRCGRVGRRQACQAPPTLSLLNPSSPAPWGQALGPTIAGWSSPVARQAHNLKVVGSNPTPATIIKPLILRTDQGLLLFATVSSRHCRGSNVEARGGRLRDRN